MKFFCCLMTVILLGMASGTAVAMATDSDRVTCEAVGAVALTGASIAMSYKTTAPVMGFNVYTLALPNNMTATGVTVDVANRTSQTLGYLFNIAKKWGGVTDRMLDFQPIGASDAATLVRGVELKFRTDYRLPAVLDDTSIDGSGTLIGTASNANGPVPRITCVSRDAQCAQEINDLTKNFVSKGDTVFYLALTQIFGISDASMVFMRGTVAGTNYGLFGAKMNNDALEGINDNPLSSARGAAIFGAPRESITIGSNRMAVSPAQKLALIGR